MNVNTQEIIDKYNQLSPELQQEALNYINFLIHKHGIGVSESKEEKTTSDVLDNPIKAVDEQAIIEEIETTIVAPKTDKPSINTTEVLEEVEVQEKIKKEERPSEEDIKLDEEIAGIEEKKKDKIAPDWNELKQAFKDEFY
ncbi:MAG: DUF2281 domain-containing protein [Chitinophagales bacterium]